MAGPSRGPAAFVGSDEETYAEYAAVYGQIEAGVRALVAVPVEDMNAETLRACLAEIGRET